MTVSNNGPAPERVMVYRLGSIGDTVVALPCLKFLRQRFPEARLSLLTNLPRDREAPVLSVAGPLNLFDAVLDYAVGERDLGALWRLARSIRAENPDLLVYLSEYRGAVNVLRDLCFFKLAGAGRIIGAPLGAGRRAPLEFGDTRELESEAARLARCLAPLGAIDCDDPRGWDLGLTERERDFAAAILEPAIQAPAFIALAAGAKIADKDWGEANWTAVLKQLGRDWPGYGLALIGGPDDRKRADRLRSAWPGPAVLVCGEASPRQSAAIMARAAIFLGTDGGPMHLAAAVGTPCCVLFGPYNRPRQWHPLGRGHHVIHGVDLGAIEPGTVIKAATALLHRCSRRH